ncbi:MAG: sirohydrochlorin chelatase [Balneola sp.]
MIKFLLSFALLFTNFSFPSSAQKVTPKNPDIGVMILAHGSMDKKWNSSIQEVTLPLEEDYHVEIAWGMANAMNMQPAITKLEEKGVKTIVAVQLFVSSYSPIIRQNEYLLGFRDSLADAPMPMMIHDMENHRMTMKMPENLQPLKINADVILTKPLDGHPLVAEILLDRIEELSINPSKETVLLVAHGPNSESDNDMWVETSNSLAKQIKELQKGNGTSFKNIISLTVRDDADEEIHEKARHEFRQKVIEANEEGVAIVIPLLLSQGGVEQKYLTRLEGLDFKWNGKTLLPHYNIARFIRLSVEEALSNPIN